MMGKMMERFFADMTAADKQKMVQEMMPKMMMGMKAERGTTTEKRNSFIAYMAK